MAAQPCVSCARSTAVGTQLFAGRRVIPPAAEAAAERSFLCEECSEQIHVAAREARMTDEQLREKIERGEIAGFTYKGGKLPWFMPGGDGGGGGASGG